MYTTTFLMRPRDLYQSILYSWQYQPRQGSWTRGKRVGGRKWIWKSCTVLHAGLPPPKEKRIPWKKKFVDKTTLPRWTSHITRIVVTLTPTSVLGLLIRDRLTLLIDCTNCTAGRGAAEGNGTASGGADSEGWHPRWCLGDGLVLACRCCWHDWCLHGCCNRSCWCYSIQPAGMQSIHAELHYSSLCFIVYTRDML